MSNIYQHLSDYCMNLFVGYNQDGQDRPKYLLLRTRYRHLMHLFMLG